MKKKLKSKKITRFVLLMLFGLFLASDAFAQQHTLEGIVKDETGEPLIGASVFVKGTTNGTTTDFDGRYELTNISMGSKIVFTYVGYHPQGVAYTGQKDISITISENSEVLSEVVVIGYGQVRKGDVTGAVTSIKADASVRGFAPNAQDMLVGKVAGVNITTEGGSPSGGKTSNMERYTGSVSITPTFFDDHLKINVNARGMHIKNRFANQDAIGTAVAMDPTQAVYDENSPYGSFFTWTGNDGNVIQVSTKNPVSIFRDD